MKEVRVRAQLLAPIAIKRDRQSERSEGVPSVAGTLVRGALASLYLQRHERPDGDFAHLFLNESTCRFGPLDPGPRIFPVTAVSCKREGLGHALADHLWFRVAQHHLDGRVSDAADDAWRQCTQCTADLRRQRGFWCDHSGRLREMKSNTHQVAAHVGIDRRTGTAAESMFYTLEALTPSAAETDLYGWIKADDAALHALRRLLEEECWRISVGHARTRGYGDMRLWLDTPAERDDMPSRVRRWSQWSDDLTRFLTSPPFSVRNPALDGFYFSLSFPAGAVIVDRVLRYTLDPSDMIDWLPPMPDVAAAFPLHERPVRRLESGGAVRWIAAATGHERLRGWNAAHGLPRQDEWAVARGSVYVYHFEGSPQQREGIIARLAALSEDGAGMRRNEGFGAVLVSDEFHHRFYNQEAQPCMC